MENTNHDKMHWRCCWKPVLGKALWVGGVLSFLGGLLAYWQGGEFYGVSGMTWYWTALVAGVLAGGIRGHGGYHCGACGPEGTQK